MVKTTRLLVGAFLVALLLMVTVVLSGPGRAGVAEASGGEKDTEQVESSGYFGGSGSYGGGDAQTMGVIWTGID